MKISILPIIIFCILLAAPLAATGADATFTLQGVVSTLSGEQVPDAEIYLYTSANTRRPADFISPRSSNNGVYRIILPRATYWGVARIKKGGRYGPLMPGDKHSGEPVKIDPETEPSIFLNFTVADIQEIAQRREKGREQLIELTGMITTPDGKAVEGAYVYARIGRVSAPLPGYFSGWTDASGKYVLKLPPGSYLLGCDRTFPPDGTSSSLQEVELTPGKLPVSINLRLPLE